MENQDTQNSKKLETESKIISLKKNREKIRSTLSPTCVITDIQNVQFNADFSCGTKNENLISGI